MSALQQKNVSSEIDARLIPYLNETDEGNAQTILSQLLLEHASPVIRQIINFKLRRHASLDVAGHDQQAAEDLYNDALYELLDSLRKRKATPSDHPPITNFRSYTAVITYHIWHEYMRARYPQRHELKNKIRYLLKNRRGLAQWKSNQGEWVGGFAIWQEQTKQPVHDERARVFLEDPLAEQHAFLPGQTPARIRLDELLAAIFDWVKAPVELDDLVSVAAMLCGVTDQVDSLGQTNEDEDDSWETQLADQAPMISNQVVLRSYLQQVWEEVCQLPVQQRMALLLNLKDEKGDCLTTYLPQAGIASLRRIAEALELTPEELARLWHDLPLEDAKIAELLGIERQRVINLRKSAREKLARRLKGL